MRPMILCGLAASLFACAGAGDDACSLDDNCQLDDFGEASCLAGFVWANPSDPDDYTCVRPSGTQGVSICGNDVCEGDEDRTSCAADCTFCGDHFCDPGETIANCAMDCTPHPTCGDGSCDVGEAYSNCPADCPSPCPPQSEGCACGPMARCDPGLLCNGATCEPEPPVCPVGTLGCPCDGASMCGGGLACDAGTCATPPACTPGELGCTCGPGDSCDTDLTCTGTICVEPPPCPEGTDGCPCATSGPACGAELVCNGSDVCEPANPPTGLPILGGGSHDPATLTTTVIATAADGLTIPRDLELHPHYPTELWTVNRGDHSIVVLFDVGQASQQVAKFNGPGSRHFLAQPAAIAFGQNGNAATIHEEDGITQPNTPADFMGATLWSTDLNIFDGGHAGHLDMLHNTPNGVGIAWARDNLYWVFDGYHNSLTRYDFQHDHGPGGADHSDGIVARFAEGEVSYVPDVSSHVAYDPTSSLLYVADTGNNRIATLDTTSGVRGPYIGPNYDGSEQYRVDGATVSTLVDGTAVADMSAPAGLELHDGMLFVSDNSTGVVFAFTLAGALVDWLDTGLAPGALNGIAFGEGDTMYVVDTAGDRVLRYTP